MIFIHTSTQFNPSLNQLPFYLITNTDTHYCYSYSITSHKFIGPLQSESVVDTNSTFQHHQHQLICIYSICSQLLKPQLTCRLQNWLHMPFN